MRNLADELDTESTTENSAEMIEKTSDENSTESFRVAFTGKSGPGVARNLESELAEFDRSTDSEADARFDQLFETKNKQRCNQSSTDELKTTIDPQSTSHSTFTESSSSQAGNSSKSTNAAPLKILSETDLSMLTESPIYPSNSTVNGYLQTPIASALTTSEEISSIHASGESDKIDSIDFIEESKAVQETTSMHFADNEASHSPQIPESMEFFDAIDALF